MIYLFRMLRKSFRSSMRQKTVRLSFFLILAVTFIATGLLSIGIVGKTFDYSIGDIAREDIRVPLEINYKIESETRVEKMRVAETVPLVFDVDQTVLIDRLKILETLFDNIEQTIREYPPDGTDRTFQFMMLKGRLPESIHFEDKVLFNLLQYPRPAELRQIMRRIIIYIQDTGVLERPYDNPLNLKNKNVTIRLFNSQDDASEISRGLDTLKTIDDVRRDLYTICLSIAPNLNKDQLFLVFVVAGRLIHPNLGFNVDETRRRIEETTHGVKPVMGVLKKGQTLVREGDTITTDALNKISILNNHARSSKINYILGILLLHLSFFIIFGYFLVEFHAKLLPDKKIPVIVFVIILVFMVYTFFLSRTENILNSTVNFAFYLPIPAVTMIIATLFNLFLAVIIGLYVIFFSFVVSGGSMAVIIIAFSSAILGVFVLNNVEKRTGFLRGGLFLGLINSLVVLGICLMEELSLADTFKNIELALASGIVNSILVLGVFPLFENMFGIVTKFNLLELSDLNAPIFKRMLIEAPGTYNHSLMVATMAEAACKEIGANYLLARVGGYYHDIGKIAESGIYIENKVTDPRSKTLTPGEYSNIIISHVRKGVDIAKNNKLPPEVIDFILEHHGQTTMTYFYHQALEAAEAGGKGAEVNKVEFQYPGPRPHSRETAVVMLADSIEAASRSLQEPSYVKLESLVKKIIHNKLNDDELEFSSLTMADLNKVQRAFMQVLNGFFHTRMEYPEQEEVRRLEQKVMNGKGEA
ncbi:MAG: HDIG domain-containing protein [Spirochaetes bacterium]|nr:MAG: HDIG domain-containing protein [Spirochaetota bacterium]